MQVQGRTLTNQQLQNEVSFSAERLEVSELNPKSDCIPSDSKSMGFVRLVDLVEVASPPQNRQHFSYQTCATLLASVPPASLAP